MLSARLADGENKHKGVATAFEISQEEGIWESSKNCSWWFVRVHKACGPFVEITYKYL